MLGTWRSRPGPSRGVDKPGRVYRQLFHGVADVRTGRQVDQDTRFQIGSISKTFTAAAILQLMERGDIDVCAPNGGRPVGPRSPEMTGDHRSEGEVVAR